MQVWLGISADGTRSRIVALNQSGKIIKSLDGPVVQVNAMPMDEAADRFCAIIDQIMKELGECRLSGIGIGAQGGGRKYISDDITRRLCSHYPGIPISMKSEAETTHLEAFDGNDGILITAGVVTLIMGRSQNRWERTGGYGHLIGDWGSSYMLGQDFLKYVAAAMELNENSAWNSILLERFGFETIEDLLQALYLNALSPSSFAPLLLEKAGEGNNTCNRILRYHLKQLAKQVFLVQQKLPKYINSFAFTGDLGTQSYYQKQLKNHILHILPEAQWAKSVKESALGACRLVMNGQKR